MKKTFNIKLHVSQTGMKPEIMKIILKPLLSTLFFCLILNCSAQHKSRIDFNNAWKFKLDSLYQYNDTNIDDTKWRILNLPHDWSIEGDFSANNPATAGGGALPGGIGWYRKTFHIPISNKNKMTFIDFDGIYRNSEVWVNKHFLGMRPNGYISFQYDITPYVNYGDQSNVIVVKVDNSKQPNSRWYSGSGIYRNVWITYVDKVHVDHWGTFISTPIVSTKFATINISTFLRNNNPYKKPITLVTTIYDANGIKSGKISVNKILTENSKANNLGDTIKQSININQPKLWSVDNPRLYKAVSEIVIDGKLTDAYETIFGIRSFNFDVNKGFSLNGKHLKILGVCDHHDMGALGSAINYRALERQLEILKGMGCNGIRTSHNPPAPELLDLCDKMGFIVMDEAFDMWARPKTKYAYHLYWKEWHQKDLESQILRDRNHPSVFMWSIGNEIPEQGGNPTKGDTTGRIIARELVNIVRALDTSRPILTANNQTGIGNNIIQSGVFDLIGYNYNHRDWSTFNERWPGKKIIVTESTSALETRGQYDLIPFDTVRRWPKRWDKSFQNPNGGYTVSAYDNVSTPWGSTHEESVKALLKNDFVSGMFIWTGFDYLGEPTPYTWPARSSYFGIIDLAGFPKDVYYMYQSIFTEKPTLHIYPSWNWTTGDTIDVISYYNNADEVELFLNGKSLGMKSKTGDDLHVKWRIPFESGTLMAISRKNGKPVLIRKVITAGKPAKILLKADRNIIQANGKDMSFIEVKIVDKNGVLVPNANNSIHFEIRGNGFLSGVDSGDPVSHESFKGNMHTALNGRALAIVQSQFEKGIIKIKAYSNELDSSTINIQVK